MILVTGVSGQLGAAVFAHLTKLGADVVGGTRRSADVPDTRQIDFDDDATLHFEDVDTLVFISAGADEDDTVIERHRRVIDAAERDGVEHITYTSLATGGDHLAFALAHRWTERRLMAGSTPWTILRNGLYAELVGHLLTPNDDGVITAPFGEAPIAAVARQDLAEAAALVALAPARHSGRTYNLVGARPFSAGDVAGIIGATYRPASLKDLRAELADVELLPFQPAMLHSIHSAATHGFLREPGTDLAKVLGRVPTEPLPVAAAVARRGE
ncbi:NAD(P)H dehydrogenase (quinone) [Arthrobacter pigmenti]|uniref:NAD(P)H dehydrogenase (Quinone) n=1 Tax=Arthrobacter pigmenti TaxID=271432 RepID=A0A846RTZ4_9MICC|nr:NAD(P)H-binding protein [Arthrobacter pigmenti]NJC24004.1 NAD(P)H dehydrogenase (quinone) [Arthrobacter pigmenti]